MATKIKLKIGDLVKFNYGFLHTQFGIGMVVDGPNSHLPQVAFAHEGTQQAERSGITKINDTSKDLNAEDRLKLMLWTAREIKNARKTIKTFSELRQRMVDGK